MIFGLLLAFVILSSIVALFTKSSADRVYGIFFAVGFFILSIFYFFSGLK
jgi:hypothetical protein